MLTSFRAAARAAGARLLSELSSLDGFADALLSAGGVVPLVRLLGTPHSDSSLHEDAASVVQHLSGDSSGACRALVAAGCVPPLIALLGSVSAGRQAQEHAAGALCHLLDDDDDDASATAVAAAACISSLVSQLTSCTIGAHAASALRRLSAIDANAIAIASAGGIPPLLALLGSPEVAVQGDAAATLFNMSVITANRGAIIAVGGIPDLIDAMGSPAVAVCSHAVAAVRNLAESVDAAGAIAGAGGIPALVALLQSPCVDSAANALGTLVVLSTIESVCGVVAAASGAVPAASALLVPSALEGIRALSARLLLLLAGSATADGIKGAISAITATRTTALIALLKDEAPAERAAGCRALRALSSDRAARTALVGAGAHAALAELLSGAGDADVRECVAAAAAALGRGRART